MIYDKNTFQDLLEGWEEVYKKGQLTLWVLVALRERSMHMKDVKDHISSLTNATFTIDDNSMYRALNRYAKAGLITHRMAPNHSGPDLKEYVLTTLGTDLLQAFVAKNIDSVFYNDEVKRMILGDRK